MTQEDKELLLRDLCARLPYGVKVKLGDNPNIFDLEYRIKFAVMYGDSDKLEDILDIINIKPYLFPFSSITDEQKSELNKKFTVQFSGNNVYSIHYHSEGYWDTDLELDLQDWLWFINWCYKNHFDIYGLISMGLALDATGLNVY